MEVALPVPLDQIFTYRWEAAGRHGRGGVPSSRAGDLVGVPFGRRREVIGLVTGVRPSHDPAPLVDGHSVRPLGRLLPPAYTLAPDRLATGDRGWRSTTPCRSAKWCRCSIRPTPGTRARATRTAAVRLPAARQRERGADPGAAGGRGRRVHPAPRGRGRRPAAARRDRQRQDRGLPAGDRRGARARAQRHLPAAGNRAHAADDRAHHEPLRAGGRRHPQRAAGGGALPRARGGGGRARSVSSSGRARPCSRRCATSASSSSTKSTRVRTGRRRSRATTPGTPRWCARAPRGRW